MRLILASASPRRLELLRRIGISPEVSSPQVDESALPGELPADYVLRVAADKARGVWSSTFAREGEPAGTGEPAAPPVVPDVAGVVLAADTAVVLNGLILGKPVDSDDAVVTLRALSGRTHEVLTSVVAMDSDGIEHSLLAKAAVTFATLSPSEIEWYVSTGEPLDKAGSYGIQGIGAVLVERLVGDPTTVIGLPLRETVDVLRGIGLDWPLQS